MPEFIKNIPGPNEKQLDLFYIPVSDEEEKIIKTTHATYTVKKTGEVLVNGKKILTFTHKGKAWVRCSVRNGVKTRSQQLHRLILNTFRPILESQLFQVNHIDGNPSNNRLDNLEWVTNSQNIQHAKHRKDENVDINLAVGVVANNVFTNETLEFTDRRECCLHFGFSRDKLRYIISKMPFGFINENGWRFKRRQDKRPFNKATQKEIASMGRGFIRPMVAFNILEDKEEHFLSMTELSNFTNISMASISMRLKSNKNLNPIQGGNNTLWEFQYTHDRKPWRRFETIWHAWLEVSKLTFPVVLVLENGDILIFKNGAELTKELSMASSTVSFRLATMEGKLHHGDGLTLWKFTNWYSLNKDKYSRDEINSGYISVKTFKS